MADPRFFRNQGPFTLAAIAAGAGIGLPDGVDGARAVADLAGLDGAGPGHLTFCLQARRMADVAASRAGVCLVPEGLALDAAPAGMVFLPCKDVSRAWALAAALFYPHTDVEPSAGVASSAVLGEGVLLGAHVVIGQGAEIGQITQENMIGKIRFGLESGGQKIGSINAENWRAWNFAILDGGGTEVARITNTWQGFASAAFTTADNYVVQMHRPLEGPLLSMVVAAGVSVDTALSQAER